MIAQEVVHTVFLVALFHSSLAGDGTPQSESRAEEIPEGASTLAFVFDVTGSIYTRFRLGFAYEGEHAFLFFHLAY